MKKSDLPIFLRQPHKEDIPFIFNSWLHSYRSSIHTKNIINTVYYGEHHEVLEKIMKRAKALIAVNKEDQNQIYGYVIYENIDNALVIHYIYVKQPFRRLGLAKTLLESTGWQRGTPFVFTHDTFFSSKMAFKYQAMYNPYVYVNHYDNTEESNEKAS